MSDILVDIQHLTFKRGDRVIYDDMSMQFQRGKVTAIMGPSGIGKTTLLKLIGGQLKPDSGNILFEGQNIPALSRAELYQARKKMSMLFQSGALFTEMTVFDNVAFPLREHTNLPEAAIRDLVLLKLHAVGLRGASNLFPSEISGGMSRRVALARAIALDPELIFYDEPFAGLDPISLGITANLIRTLNDALGATSVVVTHDIHESFAISDHVIVIANGRVLAQGSPAEVSANQDPYVQQFIKGLPEGPVKFHYPARNLLEDFA